MKPIVLGLEDFSVRPGGANRYAEELAEALAERGSPSALVTADPELPLPTRLLRFVRLAAAADGDLLDAHFALYALLPVLLDRRGRPLVVHFQGPWADESRAVGQGRVTAAVKRRIERSVYGRADALVTLSGAFKRILVERYGTAPWRISQIPPGVDLGRFSPGDRTEARRRLGLPEEGWIVATVRRLVPRMGLDVLLAAWAALGRAGTLAIGGDGPLRGELESRADSSVRLLGRLADDDLVALYRAADVTVVPSLALEGFGLVGLESLACGTPVVVSDAGGLPEAVAGLDPSLVVPAGDAAALAVRLAQPLPDLAACRAYTERFAWDAIADHHLELYRGLRTPPVRPRVVYVDHTAVLSGGELALLRLLPALDVDAHVILGEDGPLVRRLHEAGISVEVLPMPGYARSAHRDALSPLAAAGATAYTLRLALRLRRLRPDLVATNSLKAALYGGLAGRLARRPVVWHVRDRIADDALSPSAVRLVRAAARLLPTGIIANSRATLATLHRVQGRVIPSPVKIENVAHQGNGTFRVGMLGRIARWKGQHVFIEAFALAFPDGPEHAAIVGAPLFGADEDAYLDELRALADRLGLNGRLEFTGFRERIADELARLDVLVHASIEPEPFGQVVAEGMLAGLPVVAAAAGGPAEVVEDGVDGLLYPPGDTEALAEALRRLAADEPLRRRLGEAARRKAVEFTPEAVAPQILDLYREVLR
jgi:glycosyltransferase involved in cell wall biosynthesis